MRIIASVVVVAASVALSPVLRAQNEAQAPHSPMRGERVRVTTVDFDVVEGTVSDITPDRLEVAPKDTNPVTLPYSLAMADIMRVEVRGPKSRAAIVRERTVRAALAGGLLAGLFGAVNYDGEGYGFKSPAAAFASEFAGGALVLGAIGAASGFWGRPEGWQTVVPNAYRGGDPQPRPTLPRMYAGVRVGAQLAARREPTDPPGLTADAGSLVGGNSRGIGVAVGLRVSRRWRAEFDSWLPPYIPVTPFEPQVIPPRFRDWSYSLVGISEWRQQSTAVRPYWLGGVSLIRIQEDGLSQRHATGAMLFGVGAEVNLRRHLAIASDVRASVSFEVLLFGLCGPIDCSFRPSLRPSVTLIVRP